MPFVAPPLLRRDTLPRAVHAAALRWIVRAVHAAALRWIVRTVRAAAERRRDQEATGER